MVNFTNQDNIYTPKDNKLKDKSKRSFLDDVKNWSLKKTSKIKTSWTTRKEELNKELKND